MDISALLQNHVYTAVVLGSLVEGETTVVLAGYAAHQGYAPWWAVTLLAAAINFCLSLSYYALGRWHGEWLLARVPKLQSGVARMTPLLHRHRAWVIFGVRFMYGLRTAGSVALGITRVPWRDVVVFNALGAIVWAAVFSTLGYVFGKAIAVALNQVAHHEAQALVAIFAVGLAWFTRHRWRRAREAELP